MKKVLQFLLVFGLMVLAVDAGAQFTGGSGRGDDVDSMPAGPLESIDVVYFGGDGRGDHSLLATDNSLFSIIYVKHDASGSNDGTSWADAYTSFQSALNAAVSGDQIWVAKGTYKPSSAYDLTNTSRYYHFRMVPGVEIYGGFAGTETSVSQRTDFGMSGANETILSGDLNGDDVVTGSGATLAFSNYGENCYHVFYHPTTLGLLNTAMIDGFTISGGNSNGTVPHDGGGGFFNAMASPTIKNCFITENASSYIGGGLYNWSSDVPIINSVIANNLSVFHGGGIYNSNATLHISNCTFYGNKGSMGGALYHRDNLAYVNNSVFWNNYAGSALDIYFQQINGGSLQINHSCVNSTGTNATIQTTASISSDPKFIQSVNGDFRLDYSSPCLDAGNDTYNNEAYDIRGLGFGRKLLKTDYTQSGTIDMGAYEYNSNSDCINPTSGGTIAGAQTICYNADPTAFTSTTLPTGHTGTLEYKWQYSTSDSPYSWIDIASSNSEVYDASSLTQTIWFRRLARVDCESDWSGAAESNVLEVTVNPLPTFTYTKTDLTCFNAGDGTIEINGAGGSGSGYEYSIDGGSNWQTGNQFTGLASGSYSLQLKDDNGCVQENGTFFQCGISTLSDYNGNVYNTVQIGTQCWMKENLNSRNYRDGTIIPNITADATWAGLTTGARCWSNNDSAMYAATYGALYNWYAVNNANGLCPTGWHVPTDAEWTILTDFLGGENIAGGSLKETGTMHWISPNTGATNSSVFTALAGGGRGGVDGNVFYPVGFYAYFWSSSANLTASAWGRSLKYNDSIVSRGHSSQTYGFSVRCVMDN